MIGANFYYVESGQSYGPVPFQHLQQLAAAGRLRPNDLVCEEGGTQWRGAHSIHGLIFPVQPTYAPPAGGGTGDALNDLASAVAADQGYGYPAGPYQDVGTVGYRRAAKRKGPSHNGMAIAGFVLSLTIPLLGLIFSWIALNGMKQTRNDEGKGLATAGLIISIGFWVVVVIAALAAAAREMGH
jgi:hypothetical protein